MKGHEIKVIEEKSETRQNREENKKKTKQNKIEELGGNGKDDKNT